MIGGEGQGQDAAYTEASTPVGSDFVADRADGERGAFGRVDDRGELADAEHAQVRDRESGLRLGYELAPTCRFDDIPTDSCNLNERF